MGKLFKKACMIIAALGLFMYMIIPPEKQLRLGKDLRGGVSMVYSVQIDANEDARAVLDRTIDVLKRRVDPDGLMEISMVAQGRDRIEITMPSPNNRVKALKAAFEDALAELGRGRLTDARLQAAMRERPEQRERTITELASGSAQRLELLKASAAAFDAASGARQAYEAETDAAKKDAMVEQVATADLAYDDGRKAVLASALSAVEVRKVVTASTKSRFIDDAGVRVALPSARELAESQLQSAHPEQAAEIDRLLTLHADYMRERTTLDDPQDLIRMLRGAGVLSFRITVDPGQHPEERRLREELHEVGPRNVKSTDARWYRIDQIEKWINTKGQADLLAADPNAVQAVLPSYVVEAYAGDYYMLCWDTRTTRLTQAEGTWRVANAAPTVDQRQRPAIAFEMSPAGATLLGQLTGQHVNDFMAVLLDDNVYTAPNLLGEISSNGQITGEFEREEIDYIVRVLGGGSLQAKLSGEPISINSVGPQLGADNLRMGFKTALLSVVLVAGFMIVYYFGFGVVAVVALLANSILIVGAMAMSKAAFTMPGIAGVILTFGMAVDSNVLVYERIREEFNRGADMKTAVRLGFDRALSAIVDGNVTNLIVCVVLYYTGTPEIRGFAITMGIGVVATLFASLVISRCVFDIMVQMGWRRGKLGASMLPMSIPKLQHLLTPNVDWMRLRYVFFSISAVYVALGLWMVFSRGVNMLDNEFRGGTQVTLQFKEVAGGGRETMKRPEVQDRVQAIAQAVGPNDDLRALQTADVFPIEPQADGVTSDRFSIKTTAENSKAVLNALKQKFADKLESKPALRFTGADQAAARLAPVFPIEKPVLGDNVTQSAYRNDVTPYLGGAAVLLEGLDPAPTLAGLRERLDEARKGEEYSDTLARKREVIILEGDETAVRAAAVLVIDETASLFDNEQRWEEEVRDREWALTLEGLTKDSTPASVHAFSAAIADTFKANAVTASLLSFVFIGIYIWARFKTPRYSIAAVVALVHDVLTVVGLIALAEILYENPATHGMAVAAGLLPFKIDLNLVAALLTIAGYSLNDTVVIMDRIRENRGKLPHATREIINASINQTFSRTLITGGTTLGSCIILYSLGGEGMRAFSFALATGLVVGTYSSVGVAAPIVWSRKHEEEVRRVTAEAAIA